MNPSYDVKGSSLDLLTLFHLGMCIYVGVLQVSHWNIVYNVPARA